MPMPHKDPRVDAYIAKSAAFARPLLKRIRAAWHKADPAIEETIKWGVPYFQKNGLAGSMAAFKAHVSLGFWRTREMSDPHGLLREGSVMSATRLRSIDELPPESVLIEYMREAVALNQEKREKPRTRERKPVKVPAVPADFRKALEKKRKVRERFEGFAPSQRKEYIEWIVEAKQAATRDRRIAQAVQWIAEGKPRNWQYMRKKTPVRPS